MAKLYFRYGAMNSGKTTALLQVAYNYKERGMRALIIKPDIDTKWDEKLVSRVWLEHKVDLRISREDNVERAIVDFIEQHWPIHCVLVDEVQFFMPSQIDTLFWFSILKDIPVICYGLRTDFLLQSFPASERLMALAHTIEELKTICRCGKKALCNMRLQDGKPVFLGDQIAIDWDTVTYESVCGACYAKHKQQATKS